MGKKAIIIILVVIVVIALTWKTNASESIRSKIFGIS